MHGLQKIAKMGMSDLDTFRKIMIPMIRRVMPSVIAAEIVNVQPMGGPDIRYILFKDHKRIESNMEVVHTAIRPFMRTGDYEPNHHYRPWLEEHIGKQGVMWNWDIHSVMDNTLEVRFATTEHASLFELTWP